jgi:hypothetical protein
MVTQEMVAQLKPGLSREQVRFILGSPLVADMFHSDRWDYVYRFQPGAARPSSGCLTVFFQDNKLTRVAGNVVAEDRKHARGAPARGTGHRHPRPGCCHRPAKRKTRNSHGKDSLCHCRQFAGRMGRTLIEAVQQDPRGHAGCSSGTPFEPVSGARCR